MKHLFEIIVRMSFSGALVIGVILLVRQILKKRLSKRLIYSMWVLALIRLMLPVSFESPLSLFNLISEPQMVTDGQVAVETYDYGVHMSEEIPGLYVGYEYSAVPIDIAIMAPTNQKDLDPMMVFSCVWLGGVLLLIGFFIMNYLKLNRSLANVIPLKQDGQDNVYVSDRIDSPIIYGLVHPRVIIPSDYSFSDEELSYIVLHEKTHIQGFDYLIKPLGLLVLCIHWFNPLVWLAFHLSMKDMELSCDASVLRQFDEEQQLGYANTLLNLSVHQNQLSLHPMVAFGEKNIKTRIKSAIHFRGISKRVQIIGLIILLILGVILVTDAVDEQAEEVNINNEVNEVKEAVVADAEVAATASDDKTVGVSDTDEESEQVTLAESDQASSDPMSSVTYRELTEITYREILDIVDDYGYDSGIILNENEDNISLLGYNQEIDTMMLFRLDKNLAMIANDPVTVSEDMKGYQVSLRYLDIRTQNYLLGTLYKLVDDEHYESQLICMPKVDIAVTETFDKRYVLREFVMHKQSQSEIPTIIGFTLNLSGEYVSYCDTDEYYKVQEITSGLIYASQDNTTHTSDAIPFDLIYEPVSQMMPILDYKNGTEDLYFDRVSKTFVGGISANSQEEAIYQDLAGSWLHIWQDIYEQGGSLNEEQIVGVNILLDSVYGVDYHVNPIGGFFASEYESIEEMDLSKFLRYFPYGEVPKASDLPEFEALTELEGWLFQDTFSEVPIPIHRYEQSAVDQVLMTYGNILGEDLTREWSEVLFYLESTEAYYNVTSDFGPPGFRCTEGVVMDNRIKLYTDINPLDNKRRVLTIVESEGAFFIESYMSEEIYN